MKRIEFYDKERAALRDELKVLRAQQITFLTTSIAATGVLLGLTKSLAPTVGGAVYLFPLLILLPAWWIFFDKATTVSRIVGYYRILERLILADYSASKFVGWENALDALRAGREEAGSTYRAAEGPHDPPSQYRQMLLLRTSNRYWVLCYYIFLALSAASILVSLVTDGTESRVPLLLLFVAFAATVVVNGKLMRQLIYGRESYDYYEHCWKEILGVVEGEDNQPGMATSTTGESPT